MTALRTTMRFRVGALMVDTDVLGTGTEVVRGEFKLGLQLPEHRDSFDLQFGDDFDRMALGPPSQESAEGGVTKTSVYVVEVVAETSRDVDAERMADREAYDRDVAMEVIQAAIVAGRELVDDFRLWVRVLTSQNSMGLSTEPARLVGPPVLRVFPSGDVVPFSTDEPHTFTWPPFDSSLTPGAAAAAFARLEDVDSPPTARVLLEDARYLAFQMHPGDPQRAVLLAAIAAETAVKRTLRAVASPEQQDLVALVLDNPRDVSLAAASHYHIGLRAVTGRTLHGEDKQLWKDVEELFRVRNKIAHGADRPSDEACFEAVLTAIKALDWLDTFEAA